MLIIERRGLATSASFPRYPQNQKELDIFCATEEPLDTIHRFVRGLGSAAPWVKREPGWESTIAGNYGIHRLASNGTGVVVAKCGFDIKGSRMVIGHTPQGNKRPEVSDEERERLKEGAFRTEMVGHMIAVARHLRLGVVEGIAAVNNESIQSAIADGVLSLARARRIVDEQFRRSGFSPEKATGNFLLFVH